MAVEKRVLYRMLADLVLLTHWAFVLFVVFGLVLILLGGISGWAWVQNPWFRLVHVGAIGVVIAQAWVGVLCPLTLVEMSLRERAGDASYAGSFIAHWLQHLLYIDAPPWVFIVVYSLFGALVAACWLLVRPRSF